MCGKTRKGGWFQSRRQTIKKRLRSKLQAVRQELRKRWHERIAETGDWLRSVVQGYFNDHAIPGNFRALQTFRREVRARVAGGAPASQSTASPSVGAIPLDPGSLLTPAADSASGTWSAV
jgi:hypothetical protein